MTCGMTSAAAACDAAVVGIHEVTIGTKPQIPHWSIVRLGFYYDTGTVEVVVLVESAVTATMILAVSASLIQLEICEQINRQDLEFNE